MLLRNPRTQAALRAGQARKAGTRAGTILGSGTRSGYPRPMPGVVGQFRWFMGACGAGVYVGMTLAGLRGVLTGSLIEPRVLYGTPIYLGLGALLGLWAAHASHRWLLPAWDRRKVTFAVAGAVMMPLAVCFGQVPMTDGVAKLALLPGCVTGGAYLLVARRTRKHARAGRTEQAQLDRDNSRMLNELLRDKLAQQQRENAASHR
jgi:hypothetical protein